MKRDEKGIDESRYLTVEECANFLGFKVSKIRELCSKKKIPFYKVGILVRFDPAELKDWMREHKAA